MDGTKQTSWWVISGVDRRPAGYDRWVLTWQ
jgi:hypothetical protein